MRFVPLGVMLALVLSTAAHSQVVLPPRDVARPAATGTAIVSGRVLTQAGAPLRRALVTISEGPLRRQMTTDIDGKYQFAGLPAGRFSLNASKAGYVGLQYGQRRPNQPGTPVVVAAGQTVTAIDFTLPRGGVITGRITDEFGEPLTQAQVQVGRLTYGPDGQRRAQMSQNSTTDDRGEFRAFGLMPGEYVVNAGGRPQAAGFLLPGNVSDVTEGFPATYYPGTPSPEQAQTITLGVGEEVSIQFSLVAARLSRVSGIVTNSSGQPAAGAQVQVMTRQMSGLFGNGGGTVSPDGSFSIGGIPPGEHSIEIRPINRPGGAVAQSEFASVPVVVAGQDISGVSIVTGRGATVTGRLVFEGTAARPAAPAPLRVMAAPVDPTRPQFGAGPAPANNGVADADGNFQLTGLTGQFFFNVSAPPGWMVKAVTLNGEDITDVPLDVTGKTSVSGATVTLTDRITELAGRVSDENGQPITDTTIVLLPAEPLDPLTASRWIRTVRPNTTTGRYQIRGLRPGRYVGVALDYLDQGRQFAPEFQERLRKAGRDLTIREGEPITVDLRLTSGL